jgi:hypothetical protein
VGDAAAFPLASTRKIDARSRPATTTVAVNANLVAKGFLRDRSGTSITSTNGSDIRDEVRGTPIRDLVAESFTGNGSGTIGPSEAHGP